MRECIYAFLCAFVFLWTIFMMIWYQEKTGEQLFTEDPAITHHRELTHNDPKEMERYLKAKKGNP